MARQERQRKWGPWEDRLRLPLRFDSARLLTDLETLESGDWTAHFVSDNYDGDWAALPLRAPAGETHPILMISASMADGRFVDTPLLAAVPYFAELLGRFHCPLGSVRLMRLGPGSFIREHRDHDLAAERGHARLHVPIRTSAGVDFRLAGRRVAMNPGETWYLRLTEPHSVRNDGTVDRVHLVIDAVVNDWLAALLDKGRQT